MLHLSNISVLASSSSAAAAAAAVAAACVEHVTMPSAGLRATGCYQQQ